MKLMLIVLLGLVVIGLIAYIMMAIQSHKLPKILGLQQGVLSACPDSPNCVCSEAHSQASEEHTILAVPTDEGTWTQLKDAIAEQGGMIQHDDGEYLHATFTSRIFRYVDDVELRRDAGQGLIHIRSASRVGRSDFGVNRKRVENIKERLQAQ